MENNQIVDIQQKAAAEWASQYPQLAKRGIDESTWNALTTSVFPGASTDSVLMACDYCRANDLDVLMKPVHIVPMSIKDSVTGKYNYRDVIMPGVGLYRIQADRSGSYAGADAPEFGPNVIIQVKNKSGQEFEVSVPEWCRYTVYKMINGNRVSFTALEYWEENYATDSKDSTAPNAMWTKRKRGQIAKCTEAQALRRAWPEIGQMPTAEEMEGKYIDGASIKDMGPANIVKPPYPDADFEDNFPKWLPYIRTGKLDAETILQNMASKGGATEAQKQKIYAAINQENAA